MCVMMQGDGPPNAASKSSSDRTEKLLKMDTRACAESIWDHHPSWGLWTSFVATFLNWICLGLLSLFVGLRRVTSSTRRTFALIAVTTHVCEKPH